MSDLNKKMSEIISDWNTKPSLVEKMALAIELTEDTGSDGDATDYWLPHATAAAKVFAEELREPNVFHLNMVANAGPISVTTSYVRAIWVALLTEAVHQHGLADEEGEETDDDRG